jgi:hypothetical protein
MNSTDQVTVEPKPIKYVVSPEVSAQLIPESNVFIPSVGNSRVFSNVAGELDRPVFTNMNEPKTLFKPQQMLGSFQTTGLNPNAVKEGTELRNTLGGLRSLPSERDTAAKPGYVFGDVSVNPEIVQNAGQFEQPTVVKRDLLGYRTSFNSGGHIIWPLGPRGGVSTRVMERNIANLCK